MCERILPRVAGRKRGGTQGVKPVERKFSALATTPPNRLVRNEINRDPVVLTGLRSNRATHDTSYNYYIYSFISLIRQI